MKYEVKTQVCVLVDGKAVHYRKPGAVVELGDEQAAPLVTAGKLSPVGEPKAAPAPTVADDEKPRPKRPKPADEPSE